MTRIVVLVEGGCVQDVYATFTEDVEVVVIDLDFDDTEDFYTGQVFPVMLRDLPKEYASAVDKLMGE